MKKSIVCCLASALLGGIAAMVFTHAGPPAVVAQEPRPIARTLQAAPGLATGQLDVAGGIVDGLSPEERINVAVYDNANRAVVNISTKGVRGTNFFLIEIPSEGEGSGTVLDRQGHVLTNYHVVEDARTIEVTLFDRNTYRAQVVGTDPANDLAVLRIDAPADSLFPVTLGDSTRLKVGQRVFAIGNPFGLERTLTTGIISSLNRTLPSRTGRTISSIIQIDAAINPGNSGGPLLGSHGRMIGMNTAIASSTGQNTGVGFAIPASTIARIVPQLIEKGHVVRPDTGIVKVYQTEQGLVIAMLDPGGPAERAGLRGPQVVRERRRQGPFIYEHQTIDRSAADLILAVEGVAVKTAEEFLTAVESHQPGEDVTITVLREGREVDIRLRLRQSAG